MNKEKKISIIAPNIKQGGAKKLLEYLLEHLEENYLDVYVEVYLDDSIKSIENTPKRNVFYEKSTFRKIFLFFKKFNNAIYFGNLPPARKTENSLVYFHNLYLLLDLKELFQRSFFYYIKYLLQKLYIRIFISNVDLVACQTKKISSEFKKRFNFTNVEIIPFYKLCKPFFSEIAEKKFDFCYVSLVNAHKNHDLLLKAMELLSKKNIRVSLVVTIGHEYISLIKNIEEINKQGVVEIHNVGVMPQEKICLLYTECRCLIFPSRYETLGLPLIEAVEMGLDVIAADLDYVYNVIQPSLVFDPNDVETLTEAIENYLMQDDVVPSKSKINNQVDTLISKVLHNNKY